MGEMILGHWRFGKMIFQILDYGLMGLLVVILIGLGILYWQGWRLPKK